MKVYRSTNSIFLASVLRSFPSVLIPCLFNVVANAFPRKGVNNNEFNQKNTYFIDLFQDQG